MCAQIMPSMEPRLAYRAVGLPQVSWPGRTPGVPPHQHGGTGEEPGGALDVSAVGGEALGDDGPGGAQHGPACVDQLERTVLLGAAILAQAQGVVPVAVGKRGRGEGVMWVCTGMIGRGAGPCLHLHGARSAPAAACTQLRDRGCTHSPASVPFR
jgi:hypothetical protein